MTDTNVREAVPDDAAAVVRVAERGWNAAYGDLLDDDTVAAALDTWYDHAVVRERIAREDGVFLVAEHDGVVVGYASGVLADDPDVVTLGAIYVDPDHWRSGVGEGLLSRFEARCRRRGRSTVQLRVLDGNDRAASFYRAHGYDPVETVGTDLFEEPVTERVFRHHLE